MDVYINIRLGQFTAAMADNIHEGLISRGESLKCAFPLEVCFFKISMSI